MKVRIAQLDGKEPIVLDLNMEYSWYARLVDVTVLNDQGEVINEERLAVNRRGKLGLSKESYADARTINGRR